MGEKQQNRANLSHLLSEFTIAVNNGIASGALDEWLDVKDRTGAYPVVTALAAEPAALLAERIRVIGGMADVFISAADGVHAFSALPDGDGKAQAWTRKDDGDASIASLLAYVGRIEDSGEDARIMLEGSGLPALAGHAVFNPGILNEQ